MPKLRAIADALNAYPWTRGRLITWAADEPAYCALGAMLRAAGISPAEITRADSEPAYPFWDNRRPLLYAEYGIPALFAVHRIVTLNDAARSRAQAAGLILTRLSTTCPMGELLSPRQLARFESHEAELSLEAIFIYNGWELVGPLVSLRPSRLHGLPGGRLFSPAWRPKPKPSPPKQTLAA